MINPITLLLLAVFFLLAKPFPALAADEPKLTSWRRWRSLTRRSR